MPVNHLSPEDRKIYSRVGAHTSWANTHDPVGRTARAREAFLKRFEEQVDPGGVLEPEERARRAKHALKAHMARLALKSAQARRKAA